jgi:uncharacterized membrane protein YdbT with pleckstrin-like domain
MSIVVLSIKKEWYIMSYVDENLIPGERIIHRAQLHWSIFILPALLTAIGLFLALIGFAAGEDAGAACLCPSGLIAVFGLLAFISAGVSFVTSEFALTNKRVIGKVGFLRRSSLELLLSKVESVNVNQPMMGRALNYGTLVVIGSGGTRTPFKNISDPMTLRRQIQNQIAAGQ